MFCCQHIRNGRGWTVIASYGVSETGCLRPENEDRILVDRELGLFIVADGMGGHSHGEVAAEMAVVTIRRFIDSSRDRGDVTWPFGYEAGLSNNENRLKTGVLLANSQVWQQAEESPEYAGMGTTVAAVLVEGGVATIASVGDSRVYLFRQGELEPLTVDDTWVGAMVQQGTLSAKDVLQHPLRNVLTQAAGARSTVEVHTRENSLAPGDLLLLSTDGLHGLLDHSALEEILEEAAGAGGRLAGAAERLVAEAREKGAPDNVSCILLRYSEEMHKAA